MKYDILADWQLNIFCNLDCPYCCIQSKKKQDRQYAGQDTRMIVNAFNNTEATWFIHMSGGEPFLHPDFVNMCIEISKKHYISINTNLTIPNVKQFSEKVNPERTAFIHCSLHYDEKARLGLVDKFIEYYHLLQNSGFTIYVTQVVYPQILKRYDEIFDYFQTKGIIVRPKIFRGDYKLKHYPKAYNSEERETILKYYELSKSLEEISTQHIDPNLDDKLLYGDLSFIGLKCSAGNNFIFINYDGDVFRCHSDLEKLGNLYEGNIELHRAPMPCRATICGCPYYGLRYAENKYKLTDDTSIIKRVKHVLRKVVK